MSARRRAVPSLHRGGDDQAAGDGDLVPGRRQRGGHGLQAARGAAGGDGGGLEDRLRPVHGVRGAPGVVLRVGGRGAGRGEYESGGAERAQTGGQGGGEPAMSTTSGLHEESPYSDY
nr:hypothetical protein GCM10020092_096670 [Actinoplanes digitatis]